MNFNASISRHMIGILSAVINKKPVYILPEKLDWNQLYYLAVSHKISNTINYRIIGSNSKIPKDVQSNFTWSFQQAVYLDHQQSQALDQILPALSEAGIQAMVMRDFVMKSFYPHRDMRVAERLEILIEPQRERQVFRILSGMGFERENFTGSKAIVYKKDRVGEIRFYEKLESSSKKMQKYLSSLWNRTYQTEAGSSIRVMTWEDFYLYMICDIANSFSLRQMDARDIMDLWMFHKRFAEGLNHVYIGMELKNMELYTFERYLYHLCMMWFADGHKGGESSDGDIQDSLCLDLEQMIITKGEECFESCKPLLPLVDEIEHWHQKEQQKENSRRMRRWLFPNHHYMQAAYPILKHLPGAFIPLFWVIRLISLFLDKLTRPVRRRLVKILDPLLTKLYSKFPKKLPEDGENPPEDESGSKEEAIQEGIAEDGTAQEGAEAKPDEIPASDSDPARDPYGN